MVDITAIQAPPIDLSQAAAERVRELILGEKNDKLKLRVYITGGGCSGFQYGFAFDEIDRPDDTLIQKTLTTDDSNGAMVVNMVVDALSMMYLQGALIDYTESLQGAHFAVKNPNAQTTCSCGSSFSI
jgi:iron-sulfur cluster insertion protein